MRRFACEREGRSSISASEHAVTHEGVSNAVVTRIEGHLAHGSSADAFIVRNPGRALVDDAVAIVVYAIADLFSDVDRRACDRTVDARGLAVRARAGRPRVPTAAAARSAILDRPVAVVVDAVARLGRGPTSRIEIALTDDVQRGACRHKQCDRSGQCESSVHGYLPTQLLCSRLAAG